MTLAWRNQDHIRRWFLTSAVITPEQHRAWFEKYRERDDDFVFVIEETETLRRPVGQAAIYRIDRERRRAEFGRLMIGDPEAHGLGLAHLTTARLVEYAMTACGLREIYLEVLDANQRAITVYTDCGFAIEGRHDGLVVMRRRSA